MLNDNTKSNRNLTDDGVEATRCCNEYISQLSTLSFKHESSNVPTSSSRLQEIFQSITPKGQSKARPSVSCIDCSDIVVTRSLGINDTSRAVLIDSQPPTILICGNKVSRERFHTKYTFIMNTTHFSDNSFDLYSSIGQRCR